MSRGKQSEIGGEKVILENIKRLCKERGITVSALEKESGLKNATITKWDTSVPKVDNLKKVADYFGVTVDELLKDDNDV